VGLKCRPRGSRRSPLRSDSSGAAHPRAASPPGRAHRLGGRAHHRSLPVAVAPRHPSQHGARIPAGLTSRPACQSALFIHRAGAPAALTISRGVAGIARCTRTETGRPHHLGRRARQRSLPVALAPLFLAMRPFRLPLPSGFECRPRGSRRSPLRSDSSGAAHHLAARCKTGLVIPRPAAHPRIRCSHLLAPHRTRSFQILYLPQMSRMKVGGTGFGGLRFAPTRPSAHSVLAPARTS